MSAPLVVSVLSPTAYRHPCRLDHIVSTKDGHGTVLHLKVLWTMLLTSLLLAGCQIPAAMIATGAGAMPGHQFVPPTHDVPPQVIYRIDDNRYLTLENYNACVGNDVVSEGLLFYNDAKKNIRTKVSNPPAAFKGRVLLDPADDILTFPLAPV